MLNTNIFKIMLFTIAIVFSSCTSFEQHRILVHQMVTDPDSMSIIYKKSMFYDSSNFSELLFSIKKYEPIVVKRRFQNKQYKIIEEKHFALKHQKDDGRFCSEIFNMVLKSTCTEYYIKVIFEKIDSKWVLFKFFTTPTLMPGGPLP